MTTGLHVPEGKARLPQPCRPQCLTQSLEQRGLQGAVCGSERTYSQETDKHLGRAEQVKGKEEEALTR